jgi:hypothetical protein
VLTKPGIENHAGDHRSAYRGFPSLTRPLRAPPKKEVSVQRTTASADVMIYGKDQ